MAKGGGIDLEKCYLGRLCKRGHEHEGTGGSLRRKRDRGCLVCTRERAALWAAAHPDIIREINARPESKARRKALKGTRKHMDTANARCRRSDVRAKIRARERKRYAEDPAFRTKKCLQARLSAALRSGHVPPSGFSKYGIDWQAIVDHLGPRPGEGFEVDHIMPLSAFDLCDASQVRVAFAPENHRWLTVTENRRKGARLEV